MAGDMAATFVSYSRADSEFALKLAEDLKSSGANIWIDQLDIEPGMPWDRAVEGALFKCPSLLVILSSVSANSENVRDEVSFALSRQKRVIPVLYRECDVPFRLALLQSIDFTTNYERGLTMLLKALRIEEPTQATLTTTAPVNVDVPATSPSKAISKQESKREITESVVLPAAREDSQTEPLHSADTVDRLTANEPAELKIDPHPLMEYEKDKQRPTAEPSSTMLKQDAFPPAAASDPGLPSAPALGVRTIFALPLVAQISIGAFAIAALCALTSALVWHFVPISHVEFFSLPNPAVGTAMDSRGILITGLVLSSMLPWLKPAFSRRHAIWTAAAWLVVALIVQLFFDFAIGSDRFETIYQRVWFAGFRISDLIAVTGYTVAGMLTGLALAHAFKQNLWIAVAIGGLSFAVPSVVQQWRRADVLVSGYEPLTWHENHFLFWWSQLMFLATLVNAGALLWFTRNWSPRTASGLDPKRGAFFSPR